MSVNWKIKLRPEDIEPIKIKKVNEGEKYRYYTYLIDQSKVQQKIPNYYQVLGVNKIATQEEIKKAYQKLTQHWHPDNFATKNIEENQKNGGRIQELNRAYKILSDKDMRKWFDSLTEDEDNKMSFLIKTVILAGVSVLFIYLLFEENGEENS